ncbi:hypothetical protein GCM10011416_13910 [Polaribacter pacificus]|uniref:Lipoprotein n=1 Tax=Polaribacter pacificus TaxID=1775173 RepID=A0A917HZ79_9FLAO|nr:hypothetical protein [Polaribacter pacificus]GGG97157.1 hypothetical protein GCM10011416_13910 [Polaribacter pacificus]
MKKLIGLGFVFFILSSCHYFNQLSSDKILTEEIELKFNSKSPIIDLASLNSFEWDALVILEPYTFIDNVEGVLDLENIRENAIKWSDSFNLFVFLENGKSVKISEVSRRIGDFKNYGKLIKKSKAKFVKTENGENRIVE